jgi:hypothetical protein
MTACPIIELPCPKTLIFPLDFPGENTAIIMQFRQEVLYKKEYYGYSGKYIGGCS